MHHATDMQLIKHEIVMLMQISVYCAVNCYALISGYVGINAQHKISNIIKLWFEVVFYTVGLTVLMKVIYPAEVGLKEIVYSFFPVSTEQYWYFTAYVGVFLFMPFINMNIKRMEGKELIKLGLRLFFVFSMWQTLVDKQIFHTEEGYSFLWLIILYILGAAIKKIELGARVKVKWLVLIWCGCILGTYLSHVIIRYLTTIIFGRPYGEYVLLGYTSPTILMSAILMLIIFSKVRINERLKKTVSLFASASFGVYLIHVHPAIKVLVWSNAFTSYAEYSIVGMIFAIFASAVVIYIICSLVDFIRMRIFEIAHIDKLCLGIDKFVTRIVKVVSSNL